MRVLIVVSRPPWPPHTGDRARALAWIDALQGHQIVVAGPAGQKVDLVVARSVSSLVRAIRRTVGEDLPRHMLLGARDWPQALGGLTPFDVAIVLLTRTEPWVRAALPARRRILDGIDPAAVSMRERRRAAHGLERAFWSREERRSLQLERSVAAHYERVVVVAKTDAALFGEKGVAVPMGVAIEPLDVAPRDFDYGFTGRLGFFANQEAVRRLLREIWPRIRADLPNATLLLAGAGAPRWMLECDGKDGVHVESPMENRAATLRRVRVALLPLTFGSGISMKALEAAEAGCAIVATACGLRGADALLPIAAIEEDASLFARRAIAAVEDREMGKLLRDAVRDHHSRESAIAAMRLLVEER